MEDLRILPLAGVSHADCLEFRKLAGHVRFISVEESTFDVPRMKQDLDESDVEFVFAFSSKAILEIQDRIADQIYESEVRPNPRWSERRHGAISCSEVLSGAAELNR